MTVNIFSDNIPIIIKINQNDKSFDIRFEFRPPLEEEQLQVLLEIDNIKDLTEDIRETGITEEDTKELSSGKITPETMEKVGDIIDDKSTILALLQTEVATKKMMAKCLIKAHGLDVWKKQNGKGNLAYINSLDEKLREKLVQKFTSDVMHAGLDQKKLSIVEEPILDSSTTQP